MLISDHMVQLFRFHVQSLSVGKYYTHFTLRPRTRQTRKTSKTDMNILQVCWTHSLQYLLPPANEVLGKVIFLHPSFCSGGGGGIPACLAAGLGGVSRPTPRGEVEGSGQGGLKAHTRGVFQAHTQGEVSRPTSGGGWVCVSQHALRQTPQSPIWTATAAGGNDPTGMHSCCGWNMVTVM